MSDHIDPKEPSSEDAPNYISHLSENFSSIYFGELPKELQQKKDSKKIVAHIISLLTDIRNRNMKDDVLALLKNNDAADILVEILKTKEYAKHQPVIAAACWESGIDFSRHLSFFVDMAISGDMDTCVEAMTVIQQMNGPFDAATVKQEIDKVQAAPPGEKTALLSEIRLHLQQYAGA